ncbi:2-oxoglutarate-dependent dioxygenase 19-like [Malania oleifera]|uniref:2-oxoglutarate-dependent dioxygenase 19-like n=1 Tax=Malania oleifera TaxID=397392 RepID=UPI0025AE549C|nr:2-oxoglutarate-dependent dioxygenase 19-like [Malania oleifera]
MAATSEAHKKQSSVKSLLAESPGLASIPHAYVCSTTTTAHNDDDDHHQDDDDEKDSSLIPTIDFSLLTSGTPHQRSRVIQDLRQTCQDWGFFTVVNHGVPEEVMKGMMRVCEEFFDLREEEKMEYYCDGKHVMDPIRCGTSFNPSVDKVLCWRDYLKVFVHPKFHSPTQPHDFSEVSLDYCRRTRVVAMELLRGISESLGLEECYMEKALNLASDGFQILAANLYPPCPQPELAMGIHPHSDHGLLTLLIQNGIGGLQVQHNGKWVPVNANPTSFLVNTGDHMEILSNGKYKSVLHRAIVNSKATRISVALAHGPSLDAIVSPAQQLTDGESNPPAYIPMKYKDYLELQQSNQLNHKSCLDRVRVPIL